MLSNLAKLILAITAISPVALTWAVADFSRQGFAIHQLLVVLCAFALALICRAMLKKAAVKLTKISFAVDEIKAVDNEVVAYIVTYLFPLVAPAADVSLTAQAVVLLILAFVLATTNAFTFNPLLTMMGYHFYEAKCSSGVTYLLLSRNDITDVKAVSHVGRLSRHLVVDLT